MINLNNLPCSATGSFVKFAAQRRKEDEGALIWDMDFRYAVDDDVIERVDSALAELELIEQFADGKTYNLGSTTKRDEVRLQIKDLVDTTAEIRFVKLTRKGQSAFVTVRYRIRGTAIARAELLDNLLEALTTEVSKVQADMFDDKANGIDKKAQPGTSSRAAKRSSQRLPVSRPLSSPRCPESRRKAAP